MLRVGLTMLILAISPLPFAGPVDAGPKSAVSDAIDPDCTAQKAAKGAAMKATVGVGNRCGVAETARDTAGVDGKLDDAKDVGAIKPVKKIKN